MDCVNRGIIFVCNVSLERREKVISALRVFKSTHAQHPALQHVIVSSASWRGICVNNIRISDPDFCVRPGMIEVGGFEALTYKYHRAVAEETKEVLLNGTMPNCGVPPLDAWQMLREPDDIEMPWPGFVFGQTTSSMWYWCADQVS